MNTEQPVRVGIQGDNLDEVMTDYLRADGTLTEAESIKINDIEMEDGFAIIEGKLLRETSNVN